MKELFSEKQFQAAFGEQNSIEVLKDIKDESKGRTLVGYSNNQLLNQIEHDNLSKIIKIKVLIISLKLGPRTQASQLFYIYANTFSNFRQSVNWFNYGFNLLL